MESLLALDLGTTGVTAALFDRGLRCIERVDRDFPQHFPRPGWVEHDAGEILAAVDACLHEFLGRRPRAAIAAIGITNQRETVFAIERESGRALGRGIVWQDRRTAERCQALRTAGEGQRIRQRTGLVIDPYFSATKIEWMLAERPEVARAAEAGRLFFATVDALLVHHLTSGAVEATDPTNASRTLLYDTERLRWSPELLALFGLRSEWLPEVRRSAGSYGEATLPDGRRVPITGVAGDQQAALYGQGCFEAGSSKNTYGTGCFLLLHTGARRVLPSGGLLSTVAVARDGGAAHALEGSVFAAGSILQWLRDGLGLLASAEQSEALARSVPDSAGVHLVPAFSGLGAPWWDAEARAALLGLTRGTRREHVVRAALEAIAYQCTDLIELLRRETGLALELLRVDGGAAANDFLLECQADLARVTVERGSDLESTARGAALLAGVGCGLVADPAALEIWHERVQRFDPRLAEAERAARMAAWHAAVERVLTRAPAPG